MYGYETYDDARLIPLLRDGDEAAYTELYRRHWEKLTLVALAKLGTQEEARDAVQDVFVDLWHRREKLHIEHSFATYVSAALTYTIFARLSGRDKERARRRAFSLDDRDHSTEEYLAFSALQDQLEKLLITLPEKCRLVFRLSREGGLTHDEIAAQLDIAPKTVEHHITRALKSLRKALKVVLGVVG